ncbi:MAG: D-glycero-beta-D-manno-heptose 1-phosphate adenylyltransferase [Magnetovibrio sp.]|nr:D-glycero-beta-D-manno-heptose 1-phosphate adenylyltransferase [Magnetovibrio sp.]
MSATGTSTGDLIAIVSNLAKARVLCVGDAMLDKFVSGAVERISPEAPVPVLRIDGETAMLGGAGNVARNVVALGAQVSLVATVGDDLAGEEVERLLLGLGRATPQLVIDAERPTAIKTRFVAGTQQMLRADWETTKPLAPGTGAALVGAVKERLADHDVLVLSDYGKGVLADGRAAELIAMARDAGKPVIVDPKGRDYGIYADADVITPNRRELAEASGATTGDVDAAARAAAGLRGDHGFGAVLATLSQDGMVIVSEAGTEHLSAEAQEVFDVSGAGDTVVAALASGLGSGAALADSARLANVCAGIVVGKVGTAAAYMTEAIATLHHQDISRAEAKLMTASQAADRAEVWRRQGLKVGFTNGCFDLLHPGHISLLAQARGACDRLIVGLNSDASVARLKGDGRPVQNEAARATVLASLASVDLCVIFEDDTPLDLIGALKPDVLVKGADYALADVVGAEEVQSWGGRVVLADLEEGFSTTATIARLAGDRA